MNGKIGASVCIGRLELRENWQFGQKVSASTRYSLREARNHIVVETLLSNEVEGNLQCGHIVCGDGRRSAQRALRNVEALVGALLFGDRPRVLDRNQDRGGLGVLWE